MAVSRGAVGTLTRPSFTRTVQLLSPAPAVEPSDSDGSRPSKDHLCRRNGHLLRPRPQFAEEIAHAVRDTSVVLDGEIWCLVAGASCSRRQDRQQRQRRPEAGAAVRPTFRPFGIDSRCPPCWNPALTPPAAT
jgi:hypothetical protein